MGRSFGKELFLWVDQGFNVLFGGYADETISARAYRLGSKAKARDSWDQWRVVWVIADALFVWQDALIQWRTGRAPEQGHCERAYNSERARLGLPPEYRS